MYTNKRLFFVTNVLKKLLLLFFILFNFIYKINLIYANKVVSEAISLKKIVISDNDINDFNLIEILNAMNKTNELYPDSSFNSIIRKCYKLKDLKLTCFSMPNFNLTVFHYLF
jgi:hypothetical protein